MLEELRRRAVAKRWYTEQRGRVVGNTKSWDELSEGEIINILDDVEALLETMEASWQVRSSSSSS